MNSSNDILLLPLLMKGLRSKTIFTPVKLLSDYEGKHQYIYFKKGAQSVLDRKSDHDDFDDR